MARGARVPSPSVIAGRHWIGYLLTCQPTCQGILTAEPLLTVFGSRGACSTRLQMRCQYVHRRLHASPSWVIAFSIAAPRCGSLRARDERRFMRFDCDTMRFIDDDAAASIDSGCLVLLHIPDLCISRICLFSATDSGCHPMDGGETGYSRDGGMR